MCFGTTDKKWDAMNSLFPTASAILPLLAVPSPPEDCSRVPRNRLSEQDMRQIRDSWSLSRSNPIAMRRFCLSNNPNIG
jgi:hypothetical protein